jgi:ribokinase
VKPILVIGSSNTDMVITVGDLPQPGQTVLGNEFAIFAGGKGANQAVAARRAGADVRFLAAVGDDDFGRNALEGLSKEGIDTSNVCTLDGVASGVAMIFVSDAGENCIGVAPGANGELTPEMLRSNEAIFRDSSIVLIQLETPMQTVVAALELAATNNTACVLNPAPAAEIPKHLYSGLFCITPNQSEAELLTGVTVVDQTSAKSAAEVLLRRGVKNVVITMGGQGALLCNAEGIFFEEAKKVTVVDTTGAGDTFNGVFTAMIAKGKSLRDALAVAVSAATQSVQKAGAISSIPHLDDSDIVA